MKHSNQYLGKHLIPILTELRAHAIDAEEEYSEEIDRVFPGYRDSSRNLAHYLALRRSDLREVQEELSFLGLSSLGRCESCVLRTIDNIVSTLHLLAGEAHISPDMATTVDARTGPLYLAEHARKLLGEPDAQRSSRIMVTMPSEAALDSTIIHALVKAGMDIMRINTAHDGPEQWLSMIGHLRSAEEKTKRRCKIYVDLGGPKFRTGPMEQMRIHSGDTLRFIKGLHGYACDLSIPSEKSIQLSCEPVEIFSSVQKGDPLWIDDGKIETKVTHVDDDGFTVKVVKTKRKGAWLREEKGMNLPDTRLVLRAITESDINALETVGDYADIIGMSFVRTSDDIAELFGHMQRLKLTNRGVVAKIETRDGFENLPHILFEGLQHPPFGVMVARGDLAVEVGFARLAEIQEEILWLCEAAHVPVVWATQVLEGMAKKGIPTRAEVTDAAMSVRAECVMLNKGPYIIETVQFLSGILHRMAEHHSKKKSLLRRLHVSDAD